MHTLLFVRLRHTCFIYSVLCECPSFFLLNMNICLLTWTKLSLAKMSILIFNSPQKEKKKM